MKKKILYKIAEHCLGILAIPLVVFLAGIFIAAVLVAGIVLSLALILSPSSVTLNGVRVFKLMKGKKK